MHKPIRTEAFAFDQVEIKAGDDDNLKQMATSLQSNPAACTVPAGFLNVQ